MQTNWKVGGLRSIFQVHFPVFLGPGKFSLQKGTGLVPPTPCVDIVTFLTFFLLLGGFPKSAWFQFLSPHFLQLASLIASKNILSRQVNLQWLAIFCLWNQPIQGRHPFLFIIFHFHIWQFLESAIQWIMRKQMESLERSSLWHDSLIQKSVNG